MGAKDRSERDLQLASGCLVDQLFGQFLAHVCGLGYLASQANIRKTLESILRYNRKSDFFGHFNRMRSYVLNDESALVMASYPRGDRPERPFPYFNEVMTGFESSPPSGYVGNTGSNPVRNRYPSRIDGAGRSPEAQALGPHRPGQHRRVHFKRDRSGRVLSGCAADLRRLSKQKASVFRNRSLKFTGNL
jgi:non-lysosomal glucosylceramidase